MTHDGWHELNGDSLIDRIDAAIENDVPQELLRDRSLRRHRDEAIYEAWELYGSEPRTAPQRIANYIHRALWMAKNAP